MKFKGNAQQMEEAQKVVEKELEKGKSGVFSNHLRKIMANILLGAMVLSGGTAFAEQSKNFKSFDEIAAMVNDSAAKIQEFNSGSNKVSKQDIMEAFEQFNIAKEQIGNIDLSEVMDEIKPFALALGKESLEKHTKRLIDEQLLEHSLYDSSTDEKDINSLVKKSRVNLREQNKVSKKALNELKKKSHQKSKEINQLTNELNKTSDPSKIEKINAQIAAYEKESDMINNAIDEIREKLSERNNKLDPKNGELTVENVKNQREEILDKTIFDEEKLDKKVDNDFRKGLVVSKKITPDNNRQSDEPNIYINNIEEEMER